jgi:type IV pilus assembly protein PilM
MGMLELIQIMAFDLKKVFSALNSSAPSKPSKVLGIDFGSSSIKVVEVELKDQVLTLNTYGELQLGPYAETEMGRVVKLPVSKRTEALIDIMRESAISAKNGVLSLALADSFVTIMTLPADEKEDIAPRVPVEARKYIPVPLADVALEWSELPRSDEKNKKGEDREVLLAAIQNEALTEDRILMDSIQMVSQPSEIELFSTLRAVTATNDLTIAVIDVGAQMSKLYVAEEGFLRRIHRVRAGGAQATEGLSKLLSIPFVEAEDLKRNFTPNMPQAADVKKVMTSNFDRAFQEFKRVISQHELKTGVPVSRIVLTGGSAAFYDFAAYVSYAFDREVELANPFKKVAYPAFMEDTLKELGPTFATALGAALRPFEL